ncbi:MAG: hypothetical protein J0L77_06360 [Alphaproteobacteria bacterium]|nr:hypothetical protein [Alphaproteobacteria bacterium]
MAKRINEISVVMADLIKCLVDYAEHLETPPEDSEIIPNHQRENQTYRFNINSKEDRVDAIKKLLWGENEVSLPKGNRSFYDHDKRLMLQLKAEMKETGKTKEELIDNYIKKAQLRSKQTQTESIRDRLEDVYYTLGSYTEADYSQYGQSGFEGFLLEDFYMIAPWLDKYKQEITDYLSGSANKPQQS